MTRRTFRAMGTDVTVVVADRHDAGAAIVADLFETWEEAFSRFRPTSELSRVNARAGRTVAVSPLFAAVVGTALDAARASDGIFDPALEPRLRALGYDRTFEQVPADRPAVDDPGSPGAGSTGADVPERAEPWQSGAWREIELDRAARTIRLPRGAGLDLGGIAKGMAVDAAVAELARLGAGPAAVEAGGDAAVVGVPARMAGWPLRLELPVGGLDIAIPSGAVATSGISRRAWRVGGEERHHIVDPRDGAPATHALWSVTAFAASCGQAEVAAKVAFILGPEKGISFLLRVGIAGLLVGRDGSHVVVGQWAGVIQRQPLSPVLAPEPGAAASAGPDSDSATVSPVPSPSPAPAQP